MATDAAIWTTTPPSERGFYWWRRSDADSWPEVVELKPSNEPCGHLMWMYGNSYGNVPFGQFGPRIPSAAELHADQLGESLDGLRRDYAERENQHIVARSEAERRCRILETLVAALRVAVREGPSREPCRCGVEPYTNGEMCPKCHSIYSLEKLTP